MNDKRLLFAILTLAYSQAALATGYSISDGNVTFTRLSYGAQPYANLTGVAATLSQDQVFQTGWWYRISGGDHESPLPDPDSEEVSGDHATAKWNDVDGRHLIAVTEIAQVYDFSSGPSTAGEVVFNIYLKNLTALTFTVELFHYADMDLGGIALGDSADYVEKRPHETVDLADTGISAQYVAYNSTFDPDPIRHQVAAFPQLLTALNDSPGLTTLSNSGTPFGPGDFTGAYQIELTIPAGQMRVAAVGLAVNIHFYCAAIYGIFCDGFETGDRSLWGP